MTHPNPNNPSPEMIEAGVEVKRAWGMPLADERGLVRAIYLAMQAQQPNPSPDSVERALQALEAGNWELGDIGAIHAALTTLQARLDAMREALAGAHPLLRAYADDELLKGYALHSDTISAVAEEITAILSKENSNA